MSRKSKVEAKRASEQASERAAQQASEAARVLQARGQEVKKDKAPDGPPPEPRNEPRRMAMEEIYDRHNRTMGVEDVEEVQEEQPQEQIQEQPQEPPEPVAQETEAQPEGLAQAEQPQEQEKEPEMVQVKVDGQTFLAPKAEVDEAGGIAAYQRDKAAENRLKKANEALAEVQRTRAQIAQMAQQYMKPAEPPPTVAKLLQDNMDTIRWGTPEESAAAFQKVLELSNPKVDPQNIAQQVMAQVQRQNAVERFKEEFSDVVGNPLLMKLSIALENERLSQLKAPPEWGSFYRTIGNEVRSLVPRQAKPTAIPADQTSQPGDKEARKASIVNLPTAAARAEAPAEEKPETRADIINQMRKARGIPTG